MQRPLSTARARRSLPLLQPLRGVRYQSDAAGVTSQSSEPASDANNEQGAPRKKRQAPTISAFGNISITNNPTVQRRLPGQGVIINPDPAPAAGFNLRPQDRLPLNPGGFANRLAARLPQNGINAEGQWPTRQNASPGPSQQRGRPERSQDRRGEQPRVRGEAGRVRGREPRANVGVANAAPIREARQRQVTDVQQPQQQRQSASKSTTPSRVPSKQKIMTLDTGHLSELFNDSSSPSLTVTSSSAPSGKPKLSSEAARLQALRESQGGDYSRFFPDTLQHKTISRERLGSVLYAQAVLGRQRDLKIKEKENTLVIVDKLAGRVGGQPPKQASAAV